MLAARVRAARTRWLGERNGAAAARARRYYGDEYVRLVTGVDDGTAIRYAPPALRATLDADIAERASRRSRADA